MNRVFVFIGLIILLASLLRLVLLNNVPNSITYDQLNYFLNAKSFLFTGTDLTGTINLFQLLIFQYPTDGLMQAELPVFLQFPLLSFFGLSSAIVVLPNVVISVLTVFMLFLVGAKLFDRRTGIYISLIAAINPWFIFIGRTFYEMVPATFFYLCGFYILLIARGWKILLAFPLFLLAFYSYIGTKLIFFPFLLVSVVYCYLYVHKRQYTKQYIVLVLLALLTTLFFFLQLTKQPDSSRLSEIISFNHPAIIEEVNNIRKNSVQNPLTNLLENKVTVFIKVLITNFFNIFNPSYLFSHGDSFFSLYRHGLFYMIDALFLVIGGVWLFVRKRKLFFFVVLSLLISTFPQIIHDPEAGGNFTPHIALLFPFFIMLIGLGIAKATEWGNRTIRLVSVIVIGVFYILSLLNFLNIYFYQFPLQTGTFDFSSRVLSKYITILENEKQNIIVHSLNPEITFKNYLFYSNSYNRESAVLLNNSLQQKTFVYNSLRFTSCPDSIAMPNMSDLFIVDANCGKVPTDNTLSISQLSDSGSTYRIVNDRICRKYALNTYISGLKLSELMVEDLSDKEFCETFIIH